LDSDTNFTQSRTFGPEHFEGTDYIVYPSDEPVDLILDVLENEVCDLTYEETEDVPARTYASRCPVGDSILSLHYRYGSSCLATHFCSAVGRLSIQAGFMVIIRLQMQPVIPDGPKQVEMSCTACMTSWLKAPIALVMVVPRFETQNGSHSAQASGSGRFASLARRERRLQMFWHSTGVQHVCCVTLSPLKIPP
jgi:hypothetical protein